MLKSKSKKYKFKPTYLLKEKKRKRWLGKGLIWGGIFFIFAAGVGYLAIFSPIFKIRNVLVEKNKILEAARIEKVSSQILQKKIFDRIPRDNFILLPQKEIEQTLLANFPEIKKIAFKKKLTTGSFLIELEEREPMAIWCQVLPAKSLSVSTSTPIELSRPEIEKCFFVDGQGFVFRSAPIISGGVLVTVYDETSQTLDIRQTVTNQKLLEFILSVKKELAISNLNLTDFVIKSQTPGELEIIAPEGWRIHLNINSPVSLQINALRRVLEEEIKEKRPLLEYIDLRVPNRVYYKLK